MKINENSLSRPIHPHDKSRGFLGIDFVKEYNYDRYQKDLRSARDEYDKRTVNLYNWRWMGKSLEFWYSFDRALSFAKDIFKNEGWTKVLNKYLKDMDEVESAARRWINE